MGLLIHGLAVHEPVLPGGVGDQIDEVIFRLKVAFITYLRLGLDPLFKIIAVRGFEDDQLFGSFSCFPRG